jgi:predicted  nucleic acid-binding Zn-ribbon protein
MSSLKDALNALMELQQIDTQIQRLQRSQKNLDNGATAQAAADAARNVAEEKSKEYHKASGDLKDCELKLSTLEAKLKTNEQRLYQGGITNAKELGNIEKEIGALNRQRSDLDGRILELMDDVETKRTAYSTAQAESDLAAQQHATTVSEFRSKYEANSLELQDLARKRIEAIDCVADKDLLKQYEQLRAKSNGLAIVKINKQDCGGCSMTLPSGIIKSIRDGNLLQFCDNCGRILVL